jgi:tRNA (guanine-N7-)-methyltransferase
MKAKDLKPPFDWNSRRVLIHDRIWYSPLRHETAEEFVFPGWNSPALFENDNPIHVEYCSGNGAWIIDKAVNFPEVNWVAVEMKFQRVSKIWAKIKTLNLKNLIVICGEGCNATKKYIPTDSVSQSYINFPDPWPKNKHAKNRLIQGEFTTEVARTLKSDGSFTLVTDDAGYSEQMIDVLRQNKQFASEYPEPFYRVDVENYGKSYFEELWRSKNRTIRFHRFNKVSV